MICRLLTSFDTLISGLARRIIEPVDGFFKADLFSETDT